MTNATDDRGSPLALHPGVKTEPAPNSDPAPTSVSRYSFKIDLDSGSTHATVVDLVGPDKHVLELGPATGYMSKVLRERGCSVVGIEIDADMASAASAHCERMIVADIDTVDLERELGQERYDVVVAADVLEHLKDPLGALRRLAPFLVPDSGYFVMSLPNIAHGSVRLALLQGRFAYQELGLLDRTHLRFFTRESVEQLLDDADLAVVEFHRKDLNIDASEVRFDESSVPDDVMRTISGDPDAQTYQFVFKAFPLAHPGLRHVQQRFREQALELERIRGELAGARCEADAAKADAAKADEARRAAEAAAAARVAAAGREADAARRAAEAAAVDRVAAAGREAELRAALVEAHDQLLRRDVEFERLLDELQDAQRSLDAARGEARTTIAAKDAEAHMLRVRLDRITGSLPVRAWRRVGRLPLARRVVARRIAGYEAALERDAGEQ